MKVLTIGGAVQDIILDYAERECLQWSNAESISNYLVFKEGEKIEARQFGFYTGGGATNTAVAFKKLGFEVSAFCEQANKKNPDKIIPKFLSTCLFIQIPCLTNDM